jgi:hypothetical protein
MKKLFVALIFAMFLVSCGDEMIVPNTTANVIVIQPRKDGGYKIIMDGYGMNWWNIKNIVVKIDQSVPKGEPKAEFSLKNDGKPDDYDTITVYFNNIDEAQKVLKDKSVEINGE